MREFLVLVALTGCGSTVVDMRAGADGGGPATSAVTATTGDNHSGAGGSTFMGEGGGGAAPEGDTMKLIEGTVSCDCSQEKHSFLAVDAYLIFEVLGPDPALVTLTDLALHDQNDAFKARFAVVPSELSVNPGLHQVPIEDGAVLEVDSTLDALCKGSRSLANLSFQAADGPGVLQAHFSIICAP